MRFLISIVVAVALVGLIGCAKQETAKADQPQSAPESQADAQPIASEDFESGDAKGMVEENGDQAEDSNNVEPME